MSRSKLFQYAVLKHPKKTKDTETTEKTEILIQPTMILEENEQNVGFKAIRNLKEEDMEDLDRIEILVAPF